MPEPERVVLNCESVGLRARNNHLAEYQGKAICAADLPMTDYELYSYEAFRKYLHEDERPVERATLQLLDTEKIHSLALRQLLCLARKSAM